MLLRPAEGRRVAVVGESCRDSDSARALYMPRYMPMTAVEGVEEVMQAVTKLLRPRARAPRNR